MKPNWKHLIKSTGKFLTRKKSKKIQIFSLFKYGWQTLVAKMAAITWVYYLVKVCMYISLKPPISIIMAHQIAVATTTVNLRWLRKTTTKTTIISTNIAFKKGNKVQQVFFTFLFSLLSLIQKHCFFCFRANDVKEKFHIRNGELMYAATY